MDLRIPTICVLAICAAESCMAQPPTAAADAPAGKVILHAGGYWRCFITFRKPVVRVGGKLHTTELSYETAPPPDGWTAADFDDRQWARISNPPFPPGHFGGYSAWLMRKHNAGWVVNDHSAPSVALIALRGKFRVDDPAKAGDLKLSVEYRGGVVVRVNGREIARAQLPKRAGPMEVAEDYPPEAFLDVDGGLLANTGRAKKGDEKARRNLERWALHTRRLENVVVPRAALRKGVNVLAVEVHRAPYHEKCLAVIPKLRGWTHQRIPAVWSTCGLRDLKLTGAGGGVRPNAVRPEGFQVWNGDVLAVDADLDWGDPNEPLRPIRIVAARNGVFSGKVMVGSRKEIHGLRARAGDLKRTGGAGVMPADSIRVRYPLAGSGPCHGECYPLAAQGFGMLSPSPPETVPVPTDRKPTRASWPTDPEPKPVMGAVQPVWITLSTGKDTPPGEYRGVLTISAKDERPVRVPIEVSVTPFVLPDPTDYTTIVDLVQSPESVALRYKVPLWSDAHFEKIEASLKLAGYLGDDTAYLHLIARTNQGNEQTIVRWIDKGAGNYDYDFSAMDRYLDLAEKHQGRPRMLCLYVWDTYLNDPANKVRVTGLDPATGKTTDLQLPHLTTPAGGKIWGAFMRAVIDRLKKRGLGKSVRFGLLWDRGPSNEILKVYGEVAPGVKWMRHAHSGTRSTVVGYDALVWRVYYVNTPSTESLYGWKKAASDRPHVQLRRLRDPPSLLGGRLLGEYNIQGAQCGFGRLGMDFWAVIEPPGKSDRRRASSIVARYPETSWRNLNIFVPALFHDGPDGACGSPCVEMMREGLQECEARIAIERALTDKAPRAKLPAELARKCEALMAERTRDVKIAVDSHMLDGFSTTRATEWGAYPSGRYYWHGSDWQGRSAALYGTAAEVAGAVAGRPAGSKQ